MAETRGGGTEESSNKNSSVRTPSRYGLFHGCQWHAPIRLPGVRAIPHKQQCAHGTPKPSLCHIQGCFSELEVVLGT